jgi:hypothetical protein
VVHRVLVLRGRRQRDRAALRGVARRQFGPLEQHALAGDVAVVRLVQLRDRPPGDQPTTTSPNTMRRAMVAPMAAPS